MDYHFNSLEIKLNNDILNFHKK